MKAIRIVKRNGDYEELDLEKIHKVLNWACDGIKGVSVSEIEIKSQLQFFDKMKSKDIHDTLTKTAADLITEDTPNYQYVASRLINFNLRKEVYGQFEPFSIFDIVERNVKLGYYTSELLSWYDKEEWEKLNNYIKHDRDYNIVYAGMSQFTGKYLVQNRVTKEYYETPQVAYLLIAATLFNSYPKDTRLKYVKEYYDAISTFDISIPTPILAGARTPVKQYSSCVLIDIDDNLDSINEASSAIVNYVSKKAGIGLNMGRLRALGSEIRGGEIKHTGIIPFAKLQQASLKSCCLRPDMYVEILDKYGIYETIDRIQIKDLKVGDRIKTVDSNRQIIYKEVTDVWETMVRGEEQALVDFFGFNGGVEIECSINHPFMVLDGDKVVERKPNKLEVGDAVISDDGDVLFVSGVTIGRDNPTNYIDITVEDTHTFFTSNMKTGIMVLTHNSQGGVRGGAATVYFPFWHYEIESIVVLKNNKGVEENRVRHMDYGIQFCRLFYERLLQKQDITLFSPHEVHDLQDAFYRGDNEKFEELYVKYEKSRKIKMKKTISAFEFMQSFIDERVNTGRIYLQNIDHANNHGAFDQSKHQITMSNLCTEIQLATVPMGRSKWVEERVRKGNELSFVKRMTEDDRYKSFKIKDEYRDGDYTLFDVEENAARIALCTLSAQNWGKIKRPEDFEKPCDLAVRGLDALLSYQDYPQVEARLATEEFRTLGVGIINMAYFLAKNDLKYDESAFELVDEYAEAMSYYLIKASVKLAKEYGPCKLWKETKYGQGIFPFETRKKDVDDLVPHKLRFDWDGLREDIKKYGIRNSCLFSNMPVESSSQMANATSGIDAPRGVITEKASKDGVLKQVVPEPHKLKNKYDFLWDQKSPDGYLKIACILQKWMDQTTSTNQSMNPLNYENNKMPLSDIMKQIIMYYKYGGHNLYYFNTYDGATDDNDTEDLPQLPNSMDDDDDCDSCKL